MTNTQQQSISMIRLGAAALALAVLLGLVVTTQSAQAQTFTTLYNFTGASDGGYPFAGLVRDKTGNLYGTTYSGGSSTTGTVFKVNKSGTETVLYSFTDGTDGGLPYAPLVRDAGGNLYGTTELGGASGYGTVFKVDPSDAETVLHSFASGITDGQLPLGGLLRDTKGNLYGTTFEGGNPGYGTVFKVDASGTETLLHSFAGTPGGGYPRYENLIMDTKGNLYGVTQAGGTNSYGIVFKLSKSGKFTVLHNFIGGTTDGCLPFGTLVMDKKDNLYGTAESCGSSGDGVVWKLSKKGVETVLHNFAGGSSDGAIPIAGVIMDAKGNLYGNTEEGGSASLGTVYELNKKGTLTVLHSFAGSDGEAPFGGVIRDAKGDLYGTSSAGGTGGYGTVWKLTP